MEALVTAFVAAFLAEWGDKTQLIVAMLAAGTRRPLQVLAGLLPRRSRQQRRRGAGRRLDRLDDHHPRHDPDDRAGLALRRRLGADPAAGARPPIPARVPILTAFILCLAAEMGDRTQFLTFALAGRFDSAPLAAAGATAGILAACVPAAMLGERLQAVVPVRAIR